MLLSSKGTAWSVLGQDRNRCQVSVTVSRGRCVASVAAMFVCVCMFVTPDSQAMYLRSPLSSSVSTLTNRREGEVLVDLHVHGHFAVYLYRLYLFGDISDNKIFIVNVNLRTSTLL